VREMITSPSLLLHITLALLTLAVAACLFILVGSVVLSIATFLFSIRLQIGLWLRLDLLALGCSLGLWLRRGALLGRRRSCRVCRLVLRLRSEDRSVKWYG